MNKKSIWENATYNLIYQVLILFLPLITTPYVSRVIGVEGVGQYSYTGSILSYFTILAACGLHTWGQREIATYQDNKEKRTKIFVNTMVGKCIFFGISLLAYFCVVFIHKRYYGLFIIQGIQILAVLIDISWFFQGMEEFKKIIFRNFIIKVLGMILIFTLVKQAEDIYIYAGIQAIVLVLGNASLWCYITHYIKIDKHIVESKLVINYIFESMKLFIPILAVQTYSMIDKTMLGLFSENMKENGYYEQAQKIVRMLQTVATSLGMVLLPRISLLSAKQEKNEIRRLINDSIDIVLCITVLICSGMVVVAKDFLPLFLGKGYEKSVNIFYVLVLIIVVSGVCNIIGNGILIPFRRQSKATLATCIGAFVNVVLNIALIPHFYALGAAIASLIAEVVVLIIHAYYSRDVIFVSNIIKKISIYSVIAFVGMLGAYGVNLVEFINNVCCKILIQILIVCVTYLIGCSFIKEGIWCEYIMPKLKMMSIGRKK